MANRVSVLLYVVLHTNLELSSQFALSQLPRITSDPLVLFQLIFNAAVAARMNTTPQFW